MKILFLSEFFYPHWTGYAQATLRAALRLTEAGHEITVLATRHDPALPPVETYRGIVIYRAEPWLPISRTQYSWDSLIQFSRLVGACDLIFLHTPHSNTLPFSLMARIRRKPTLVFLHGDLILPRGWHNRLLERIFDFSMHLACRWAAAVSTSVRDYAEHSRILRHYLHKFHPLLLPMEMPQEAPDPEVTALLTRLRQEKGAEALVGFAGRFVEEKAFDILLQAIPLVVREKPRVHFVYAGDFPHYEDFFQRVRPLWDQSAQHLTHLGLLRGEGRMIAFFRHLDLFVLPSRSDCFAIVQAEAMSQGVPVVVTNIPGARWLVRTSGFGLLAEPEDPASLAAAILDALTRGKAHFSGQDTAMALLHHRNFLQQFDAIASAILGSAKPG